ncbi:MAG: 3-hydroxybutyrate dehydrogenase [Arenibacter algicola]
MKNKVVFITGAANGIGLEIGKDFAKQGAKVIITDLDSEKIALAVLSLESHNLSVEGIVCDVTIEKEIKVTVENVYRNYGTIDVLINNAGLQYISAIEDFPIDKFEKLIKVMLVGPFILMKYVLPIMKKRNCGRIINMASVNGLVGFAGKSAYNSAKHGLIGLTKVAALEVAAYNITVNAVCPGYVNTTLVQNQLSDLAKTRDVHPDKILEEVIFPLVPQKRLLEINEISNYVLFLASDKARGITGQAVVIDGGYIAQ